ncbi:hypothetical protein [Escherichia coli]|uniref:hypothetical protein n=1 Tax=Escherichia coli TaxID=562 RepID=UPI0021B5CC62|nr:hypothetical protein [Escherichia coli]MCT7443341.1 hypothetical protein [Escherichia coli]
MRTETLRKDWEQLDGAKEILEDLGMVYLEDKEYKILFKILNKIEVEIVSVLGIQELGFLSEHAKKVNLYRTYMESR